jgi:hypothetical protein
MVRVTLVQLRGEILGAGVNLLAKGTLFQNSPAALAVPYVVRSPVSLEIFRQFTDILEGSDREITNRTAHGLELLSGELGFEALHERVWGFRGQGGLAPQERRRIAAIEEAKLLKKSSRRVTARSLCFREP